jgi:hypothetical protein
MFIVYLLMLEKFVYIGYATILLVDSARQFDLSG